MKKYLFFTPDGDLFQLPVGSTPVDFGFQVHTQIGMHCMGAKVNHLPVPQYKIEEWRHGRDYNEQI